MMPPTKPIDAGRMAPAATAAQIERRKQRLMQILGSGLPTLPSYVLDLNALLTSPSVDLKKVGKVIRTDPSLSAQVLRLCNSALFGLRRRVISIEQAAVLLGTERLRTLVLTCSIMQFAGKRLAAEKLGKFWQHSFLAALLSERIARQIDYFEKEQAYLGGLLHDIGQLPLWIVVVEDEARHLPPAPSGWADDCLIEREYFGMDHCKIGRWMAVSWNFMPSFLDVFEAHHHPERAKHDPYLVGIIAVADRFLNAQLEALPEHSGDMLSAQDVLSPDIPSADYIQGCLPQLAESERHAMLEMLQTEYIHLLPLVQLGITAASGNGEQKSGPMQATAES